MPRIPNNAAPHETPYPHGSGYDPRLEASYWLTLPAQKLEAMLRAEAKRGRLGHWTYDLARHERMFGVYEQVKAKEARAE